MKKIIVFLIVLLCSRGVFAQDLKLPGFYSLRESAAPLSVKDKLSIARKEIADKNLKYIVGYTSVSEFPLEKITGFRKPSPDEEKLIMNRIKPDLERARRAIAINTEPRVIGELPWPGNPYVYGNPAQSKLDLRQAGYVSPMRDQKVYGSCWAFSAMAAYESSYKILTKTEVDASEEFVVNCSGAGNWGGGWMYLVFDWMVDNQKNVADESIVPYTGPPVVCPSGSPGTNYYAKDWGLADPSRSIGECAPVSLIKEAICKYGVISSAVCADNNFKLYVGGAFYGFKSYTNPCLNHGVAIIGWDDAIQCWLIKNSWGTGWGSDCGYGTERGYMWIRYDSNNIGSNAIWIRASNIAHNP